MKRFLIFFTMLVLTTNTALARCHGHYHGSYHYHSTPVYLVRSDYYENEDNDGHFMFAFYNFFDHDVEIKKGEAVGQAIFMKYLTVDNDEVKFSVVTEIASRADSNLF